MWLQDPLRSPLLPPAAVVLAGLLGGALLAMLLAERGHRRDLPSRTLFRRWCTWLAIAPLYTLAVLAGPAALLLLVSALVAQGLREYGRLVGLPRCYRLLLPLAGVAAGPLTLAAGQAALGLLLVLATLPPLLTQDVRAGARHLAFAALGFGYLPLLLGHLLLIARDLPGGAGLLLALGLAVALSDVGAYLCGRRFGRRRLAPRLSPAKTIAGLAGNLAGAYAGVALMAFALPAGLRPALLLALPPLVVLGAAWGDLLESLLKREFGAKDAAGWLPGFGGLLDRIDSLIVVAPLGYYFLRLLGWAAGQTLP